MRFWKTLKPVLSDKLTHKEKINLSEKGEILKTNMETVSSGMLFKILTFFDFQILIA